MSFSRQLTQLGLLGTFTLVGLSACTTWHGYQAPQAPCGPSPQTIVTTSPPVIQTAPSTTPSSPPSSPLLAPPSLDENSPTSTPAVPNSMGQSPTAGADSAPSKPADVMPPPPAPPAAPVLPSAGPEPSAATSAPAAESNHDQLRTQKPLDTTTLSPEQADGGTVPAATVAANAAPPSGASVMVTIPPTPKARPASPPPGALAKLRARFHNLIQPNSKSTAKTSKDAKPSGPAAAAQATPQVVSSVHIPLPLSDPNRVVQEDSRAAHMIAPAEGQSPVSTAGARDAQPGTAPANAVGFQMDQAAEHAGNNPPATQGVEAWPFGPQAAASANKASTDDFDPMPVEEYKAAIAAANGANSPPSFNRTSPSSSQQSATAASNSAVPQPMTAAPPASELQVVPAAVAPAQDQPMLPPAQPQTIPTAATGTTGSVAPASQVLPATSAEPAMPTPPRPVQPSQWVGGRYGQPVWMVPYLATPAGPAGQ